MTRENKKGLNYISPFIIHIKKGNDDNQNSQNDIILIDNATILFFFRMNQYETNFLHNHMHKNNYD